MRQGEPPDMYCTNRPGLVTSVDRGLGILVHSIVIVDTENEARLIQKPGRPLKQWPATDWITSAKRPPNSEETDSLANIRSEMWTPTAVTSNNTWTTCATNMSQRTCPAVEIASPGQLFHPYAVCVEATTTLQVKVKGNKDHYWGQYLVHWNKTAKAPKSYVGPYKQHSMGKI